MSRTLTPDASTAAATVRGSAPRLILRIDWGGSIGTKYYADTDMTTPVTAEGRIVNANEIALALSEMGVHSVSDVSITLADADEVLSGYCGQTPLELKRATLYQHFIGGSANDLVPLLSGHVDDPVVWRESDATLSFDITDIMTGHDVTIGHVASSDDFETIVGNADGAAIPLVFGRVDELKCLQVEGGLRGSLLWPMRNIAETIYVENGENFPQDQTITLRIVSEDITGVMRGRAFTITDRTPQYTTVFAGTTVRLADDQQVYIANDARSLAVHKVYAMKTFKIRSGRTGTREIEQMVEVPASLYTVNLNDTASYPSLGRAVTTITFPTALTDIDDDEWSSDDIWVDISGYTRDGSTLVESPADVIRYLLQDFGDVPSARIDSATFAAAKSSLGSHVFAFALREQKDLRDLVSDLAYQAQCQLMVIAAKVYLFFVSDTPGASAFALGDATVARQSVERTWLPVEDVWSEVTVSYQPDLSARSERPQRRFTLRDAAAESQWGRRANELNFWAYRDLSMAKTVAQHYLNHHAAAWQRTRARLFLDALDLLPLDWVSIGGLPWWDAGQMARLEGIRQIPGSGGEADSIEVDLFVPVHPGCSGGCEVACEAGGCEGASEHTCGSDTGCGTACETGCQEACQLICVTTCQASCQLACQLACETAEEVPEPEYEFALTVPDNVERGVAFNVAIQSRVIDPAGDDTDYTPDGNVAITLLFAGDDSITPATTSATGWSSGAKTVSCTVDGGTGAQTATIRVEDTATGRIGEADIIIAASGELGFELSGPASVTRDESFDITIQSVDLSDGSSDTGFTPSGDVTIAKDWETVGLGGSSGTLTPSSTDNSGWSSGAKTVSCTLSGGSGDGSVKITATDPDSGRTGSLEIPVAGAEYGFVVTAPANIERGTAFNLAIQSVELPAGTNDTTYTPTGTVAIEVVEGDDGITPSSTDATGWSSGAKTVSCTLTGGSGVGAVKIRVRDTASGRVGYANFGAGEGGGGDSNIIVGGSSDYGFELTSASAVTRFQAFNLNLQSVLMGAGTDDTAYTPTGDVNLTDTEDTYVPSSTDNTGWANGGKDVGSVIIGESTGTGTVVTAVDPNSDRTGSVLLLEDSETVPDGWQHDARRITVNPPDYAFAITAPESAIRDEAFDITIQSVDADTQDADTGYTPSGDIDLYLDVAGDTIAPETTDNTGWSSGAKTVSVTLSGGTEDITVRIYAHDTATGRIGYAELPLAVGYGFELTAPGQVDPDTDFTLTIQSIESVSGDPDTAFEPAGDVELTDDHVNHQVNPWTVNDVGWEDGAKTVTCQFQGGTETTTVRLTATDPDSGRTGYIDITVGQQYGFIVTAPLSVERDIAFDVTVQSYDLVTGELDTSFVPSGDVTTELTDRSDEADTWGPPYIGNSDWSDGKRTFSMTISNGSGSDTARLHVNDPNSGRDGYADIAISPSTVQISPDEQKAYYGGATAHEEEIDNADPEASSYWAQTQTDAQMNFINDTVLANAVAVNGSWPDIGVAGRAISELYSYVSMVGNSQGGYVKFTTNSAQRTGAIMANLIVEMAAEQRLDPDGGSAANSYWQWSPLAYQFSLKIKLGTSGSDFGSGYSLQSMTPDITKTFSWANQQQVTNGATDGQYVSQAVNIAIPIPVAWLSDTVYLWLVTSGPMVPYGSAYYGGVGFAGMHRVKTDVARLEILK